MSARPSANTRSRASADALLFPLQSNAFEGIEEKITKSVSRFVSWRGTYVRYRAEAVAYEQEMQALTQENRAKVILAEAEVPKAMAAAFQRGQLRVSNGKA